MPRRLLAITVFTLLSIFGLAADSLRAELDAKEKQLEQLYAEYWRTEYRIAQGEKDVSSLDVQKRIREVVADEPFLARLKAARFGEPTLRRRQQIFAEEAIATKISSDPELAKLVEDISRDESDMRYRVGEKQLARSELRNLLAHSPDREVRREERERFEAEQRDFLFFVQFFGDAEQEIHCDTVFVQDLARLLKDELGQGLLQGNSFADFDGINVRDVGFAREMRPSLFLHTGSVENDVGLGKAGDGHAFIVRGIYECGREGFGIEDEAGAIEGEFGIGFNERVRGEGLRFDPGIDAVDGFEWSDRAKSGLLDDSRFGIERRKTLESDFGAFAQKFDVKFVHGSVMRERLRP